MISDFVTGFHASPAVKMESSLLD